MSAQDRLNYSDLRAVLEAVELLQADHSPETLGPRIETALRRAIGFDSLSIDRYSTDQLFTHVWATRELEATFPKYVDTFMAHLDQHQFLQAFLRDGLATARRVADVMAPSAFKCLGIYNEFYKQVGTEDQLAVGLPTRPPTVIAINRSSGEFTPRDRRLLQSLRCYCTSAVLTSHCIGHLRAQRQSLLQAIDSASEAVVFLGRDGRIRFVSEAGRILLEACFGRRALLHGALPAEVHSWLRTHWTRDASDLPSSRYTMPFEQRGCSIALRFVRSTGEGDLLLIRRLHSARGEAIGKDDNSSIDLTPREREILRWVEDGMANADIALLVGVSVRTVDKHLQHAFAKLNVENRTAAVRKLRELG
jgi:DNA-binding CsgD family transcriptional regulator